MVASEAHPFSKTGGLADVASALPRALGALGHEVILVTPRYCSGAGVKVGRVGAGAGDLWLEADLYDAPLGDNARALLVDCPPLYDRSGIYGEFNQDYADNAARFAFLSLVALEIARRADRPFSVLHGHDWQAGLMPVYAQRRLPCVFTIHNLAFQGNFDKSWVPRLGLRWDDFTPEGFEFWDRVSFLKAGIVFADQLTTVSPTYAREIQQPEFGHGFDGILRAHAARLTGILNGIDIEEWNPARDPHLPVPFDAHDLSGKAAAKRALLELFRLPATDEDLRRPVVAMVSRMTEQKGLDLIAALAPQLPSLDAAFTIVGTGEARFEGMWRALADAHPTRIGVFVGFDEHRAHLVEGGADIFLMPSRYEPCGLNQMYSMRYGTVPVARAVGGLADTVRPFGPRRPGATGFLFRDYRPEALWETLQQAVTVYREQPRTWRRLQRNGMTRDFSWERSAAEYVKVYKRAMARRRKS